MVVVTISYFTFTINHHCKVNQRLGFFHHIYHNFWHAGAQLHAAGTVLFVCLFVFWFVFLFCFFVQPLSLTLPMLSLLIDFPKYIFVGRVPAASSSFLAKGSLTG